MWSKAIYSLILGLKYLSNDFSYILKSVKFAGFKFEKISKLQQTFVDGKPGFTKKSMHKLKFCEGFKFVGSCWCKKTENLWICVHSFYSAHSHEITQVHNDCYFFLWHVLFPCIFSYFKLALTSYFGSTVGDVQQKSKMH